MTILQQGNSTAASLISPVQWRAVFYTLLCVYPIGYFYNSQKVPCWSYVELQQKCDGNHSKVLQLSLCSLLNNVNKE
jgi:hypothetical protein